MKNISSHQVISYHISFMFLHFLAIFQCSILLHCSFLHNIKLHCTYHYITCFPTSTSIYPHPIQFFCDFLSQNLPIPLEKMPQGTVLYMSPEMIRREGHGLALDFYCLGCLLPGAPGGPRGNPRKILGVSIGHRTQSYDILLCRFFVLYMCVYIYI